MVIQSFNHSVKQNGSPWVRLLKDGRAEQILIVAIDVGKYTHKVMFTNVFQDTLIAPY